MKPFERYIAAEGGNNSSLSASFRKKHPEFYNTEGTYDFSRDFEDVTKDDIIYKKNQIINVLKSDPDLENILLKPTLKPLNKFKDEENPTKEELEERRLILEYNKKAEMPQIYPWLKLNDTQLEVNNYICVDIYTERRSYDYPVFNRQFVIVMCLVSESDMETEYENVTRADLLSYIIMDLLQRSSVAGMQMQLESNEPKIIDDNFYCRELRFVINQPNIRPDHGTVNRYDRTNR